MNVRILRASTPETQIPVPEDAPAGFADAQKAVGGPVEVVSASADYGGCLLANEEGQLRRLPMNYIASAIAGRVIVGDVVQLRDAAAIAQILGGA